MARLWASCQHLGPAVRPWGHWKGLAKWVCNGKILSQGPVLLAFQCIGLKRRAQSYLLHKSLRKIKAIFFFFSSSSFLLKHWVNLIQGIKTGKNESSKLRIPSYPFYLWRCLICSFLHSFSLNLIVILSMCRE